STSALPDHSSFQTPQTWAWQKGWPTKERSATVQNQCDKHFPETTVHKTARYTIRPPAPWWPRTKPAVPFSGLPFVQNFRAADLRRSSLPFSVFRTAVILSSADGCR